VGGILFRAHEWADWEQSKRSYELFARWVMPRFQGSLETVTASRDWARANRRDVFGPNVDAIRRAYTDAGHAVPAQFADRAAGARDVVPEPAPAK
jgi:limonene 1,2-monooxygenase